MFRIRTIEEKISKKYSEQKMRCPVHLSIGQELVPSIFQCLVKKDDFAVSTHRGHAHYLGKGGNLKAMLAEIYGKQTGCSGGFGGSMHLIDLKKNFMGTSAIVGNNIPLGVGLGLSLKNNKNNKNISIVFLGDGATEEGVFYESLNFASLHKIPVLFICENNFYSVYSSLRVRRPKKFKITQIPKSFGIDSICVKDNNLKSYYLAMKKAFNFCRRGKGPFFLEYYTYRWLEHCGPNFDNNIGYRSNNEYIKWKKNDPYLKLEKFFLKQNKEKIFDMKKSINKEIDLAFKFAVKSKYPNKKFALSDNYK